MPIEAAKAPSAAGKRVLVVDDADDDRLLVGEVLEEAGYRASLATTAIGLDAVKRHAPDLVLLDPTTGRRERGWRLLRRLRADPATATLPVVVCTGAVQEVREEGALLAKPRTGLVLKPFDVDALVGEVASQLEPEDPTAA